MKLNAKGLELFNKWEHIYVEELTKQREQRGDPEYCEGWSIIDDSDHIRSVEDAVGLAVFGDDDRAIYHILQCIEYGYFSADEEYCFGVSAMQFVELLKPYFEISESEETNIRVFLEGSVSNG